MLTTISTALAFTAILMDAVLAQDSSATSAAPTVNMFINDVYDGDASYAASIVSACSDQTVYALQCTSAAEAASDTCGPNAPTVTITSGPSMYEYDPPVTTVVSDGVTVVGKVYESCALSGTTAASCIASISASAQGESTKTSDTTVISGTDYHRFDVEITGGAEKTASATGRCSSGAMVVTAKGVHAVGYAVAAGIFAFVAL